MQIISNQVIISWKLKWYKLMTIQAFTKENTGLLDLLQVITTYWQLISVINYFYAKAKLFIALEQVMLFFGQCNSINSITQLQMMQHNNFILQLITNKVIGECIIVGPNCSWYLIIGFITISSLKYTTLSLSLSLSFSQSMIMPVEDSIWYIPSNNH